MKIRPSKCMQAVAGALATYTNDSGKEGHERGIVNARALGLSKHPRARKAPKKRTRDLRTKRGRVASLEARYGIKGAFSGNADASMSLQPAERATRRLTARSKSSLQVMTRAARRLKGY